MGLPKFIQDHRLHNKFNAVPKRYEGKTYHSTLEADYAAFLDKMKRDGRITLWEPQPKFDLVVNDEKIGRYIPDFLVVTAEGSEQIHEVKGKEQELWRFKWRLMQALYPEFEYYVVKKGDF